MNSPFLFDLVSNFRAVPSDISIVTLAPSTGFPCMSLTTPLTMPVDCAAAGSAIAHASRTTHPISHGSGPLIRRIMDSSKNDRTLVYFFLYAAGPCPRGRLLVMQRADRIE